jgi:aldose sugar dehydrogenase
LTNVSVFTVYRERSIKIKNSTPVPRLDIVRKALLAMLIGGVGVLALIVAAANSTIDIPVESDVETVQEQDVEVVEESSEVTREPDPEVVEEHDVETEEEHELEPVELPRARSLDPFVQNLPIDTNAQATLESRGLTVAAVATGLSLPTSMAFVDDMKVIVLEKNSGKAYLVALDSQEKKQLLDLRVANGAEQGLLGVAVVNMSEIEGAESDKTHVFIYLTEVDENDVLLGNRIYRYDWNAEDEALVNPVLIVHLPADPGPVHNGGKLVSDNKGHLYTILGDLNRIGGPLQNQSEGVIDDSSILLRVDYDGNAVEDNPFYGHEDEKLHRYFAYGIRNGFGLDFDPVTGTLWITENGMEIYDEINVVNPGFNSGWSKVMGPIDRSEFTEDDLFLLEGAEYQDPVFSWRQPIGVTDIVFVNTDRLGEEYKNNIFVGDINGGALYYFKVNESRTGLDLSAHPQLTDRVAETYEEGFLFKVGSFPGGITDLEIGPDGFLYVLTFNGNIHVVVPTEDSTVLVAFNRI